MLTLISSDTTLSPKQRADKGPKCPACGDPLRVNYQGVLICDAEKCPRPLAATEILSDGQGTDHIVRFESHSYSIKHPLIERCDDELLDCWVGRQVGEFGETWVNNPLSPITAGVTYRMWAEGEGEDTDVNYQPIDEGRVRD
jgi:hypothetical protein